MKWFLIFSISVFGSVLIFTLWPYYPEISYFAQNKGFYLQDFGKSTSDEPEITVDSLIIPRIRLNAQIYEGSSEDTLNKGIWHRPNSSDSPKTGNFVLTAHRFLYTGFAKNTFYHLDKLDIGDSISIIWDSELYTYRVIEKFIVKPTDIYIEQDFGERRLTLYTCHPLWTSESRLVIVATPV